MNSSIVCNPACGAGSQGFPIFTGRRVTTGNLPTTFDVAYVLSCPDGRLYRRQRTNGGEVTWSPVNLPQSCPYVFYDLTSEMILLQGFGGQVTSAALTTTN